MKKRSFTLLELLIALSIVSIGLISLVKSETQQSQYLHQLEQKNIANLVISNLAVERRLQKNHSIGYKNGSYPMGRNTWYWQSNTNATANDQIIRMSLLVFPDKQAMSDKKSAAQLELYLAK